MSAFTVALPFLPAKPIIIDGGANEGQTVSSYLAVRIQSCIHSFEPDERAFEIFSKQQYSVPVYRNRLALSDHDGVTVFHKGAECTVVSSPFSRVEGLACHALASEVEVPCTTLDTYANEAGLDHIDLLKLDLQGGELLALTGAHRLLSEKRVGVIISEVWMLPSYAGAPYYWQVAQRLDTFGFKTWWINTESYPDVSEGRWGDAVFVHEDLLRRVLKMEFNPR
jgi:FkbM family methyltransferase